LIVRGMSPVSVGPSMFTYRALSGGLSPASMEVAPMEPELSLSSGQPSPSVASSESSFPSSPFEVPPLAPLVRRALTVSESPIPSLSKEPLERFAAFQSAVSEKLRSQGSNVSQIPSRLWRSRSDLSRYRPNSQAGRRISFDEM